MIFPCFHGAINLAKTMNNDFLIHEIHDIMFHFIHEWVSLPCSLQFAQLNFKAAI